MFTILCIILFRISCQFSAVCCRIHALFSKLFSRLLSKQLKWWFITNRCLLYVNLFSMELQNLLVLFVICSKILSFRHLHHSLTTGNVHFYYSVSVSTSEMCWITEDLWPQRRKVILPEEVMVKQYKEPNSLSNNLSKLYVDIYKFKTINTNVALLGSL